VPIVYSHADHKRAFELWCELQSFRAVSGEPHMPSHMTIARWSSKEYPCRCPYHGWDVLLAERREHVREVVDLVRERVPEEQKEDWVVNDITQLQVLRKLEKIVLDAVDAGFVKPKIWQDVVSTIAMANKERRLIMGEPTEAVEQRHSGGTTHDIRVQQVIVDSEFLRGLQQAATGDPTIIDLAGVPRPLGRGPDGADTLAEADRRDADGGDESPDSGSLGERGR
jgi:hypothetical protein